MTSPRHEEEVRSLLSEMPAELGWPLLHVLRCPQCREWAADRLLQDLGAAANTDPLEGYDSMWSRLEQAVPQVVAEAQRRSTEAEQLLLELLGYPQDQQAKALLEARFQSPPLLELLLETSQQAQPAEPEASEALSDLAGQLAAQIFCHQRTPAAEIDCALYSCRAATIAGNAHRLLGRALEAEATLRRAACFLAWPFESWDRAAFCRVFGLLRWDQGRLDEAEALLGHAAWLFSAQGMVHEEGATLVLLGLLALEENKTEAAIRLLRRGRRSLDPQARPWLTVRAGLGLALAVAGLGQTGKAAQVLEETWHCYASVRDEREQVRIYWLEGRICALTGKRDEAEQLLASVRLKLIAEHSLPDAALCSLDLGAVLIEAGRPQDIGLLHRDLETSFPSESGALEVTGEVLHRLAAAAGSGRFSPACTAETASVLRRAFRFLGYRVDPLPFA